MMPPCGSDVSCIAFTTGTAVFAVLHWLLELRCARARAWGTAGSCLHHCVRNACCLTHHRACCLLSSAQLLL